MNPYSFSSRGTDEPPGLRFEGFGVLWGIDLGEETELPARDMFDVPSGRVRAIGRSMIHLVDCERFKGSLGVVDSLVHPVEQQRKFLG